MNITDLPISTKKFNDANTQSGLMKVHKFEITKRIFDIFICILLFPFLVIISILLIIMNPLLNSGTLIFRQMRMGKDCRPFQVYKFRTMRMSERPTRHADDPLERDRITPLGHVMRRTRLDELPQILNVLKGEMSLIGPRPDCYEFAQHYIKVIPGYRNRHSVKPGISGLAQVELGYVEGVEATFGKVRADLRYIARRSLRLEMWILLRTVRVIFARAGA